MRVHFKSIYALVSERFKHVSFNGLLSDHPYGAGIMETIFKKVEAYEALQVLKVQETIDEEFLIFVDSDTGMVLTIEKKEWYSQEDCELICQYTDKVNMDDFRALIGLHESVHQGAEKNEEE